MRPKSSIGVICLFSAAILLLLVQIWWLRELSQFPIVCRARSLETFPSVVGRWKCIGDVPAEPELLRMLKADEVLSRSYKEETTGVTANLLVAYYRSQRNMHQQYDLEEYLPDQGWSRLYTTTIPLSQQAVRKSSIRYELVLRGHERRLLLRWFETRGSVLADGQELHLYRAIHAATGRPTDLARVQIVTPVRGDNPERASSVTLAFAQQVVKLTTAFLSHP